MICQCCPLSRDLDAVVSHLSECEDSHGISPARYVLQCCIGRLVIEDGIINTCHVDVDPSSGSEIRSWLESMFQYLVKIGVVRRMHHECHGHLAERIDLSFLFNGWWCWTTKSGLWLWSSRIFGVLAGSGLLLALAAGWKVVLGFLPMLVFWLIMPHGSSKSLDVNVSCVSATASDIQLHLLVVVEILLM